jgi:hypothetical protein
LLFLRPRRFGKSLLLSMLEHYYDIKRAEQFDALFGRLAIAKNPAPLHKLSAKPRTVRLCHCNSGSGCRSAARSFRTRRYACA